MESDECDCGCQAEESAPVYLPNYYFHADREWMSLLRRLICDVDDE